MKPTFKRSIILLYLLACYVVFQFLWWAYYLVTLHRQVLTLEIEAADSALNQELLDDRFQAKLLMVLGEGAVFLTLLFVGIWKLNQYLQRERKLAQLQSNFMLSVTHELKSPIAAIRLHLETMQRRELDRDKQEEIIARSLEESQRLDHLTENILLASRIEKGGELFHFEKTDFSELVKKVCSQLSDSQHGEHYLEEEVENGIEAEIDRFAVEVLLKNLIENAQKYTPAGTRIQVVLKNKDHKIILTVADEGPGIENAEKEEVFKKFYRTGSEQVRKSKGTGLGLFLVKEIAMLHRAKVTIEDNYPQGSIFRVIFNEK
ncbi:sensor histidine kinase [Halocola ammonii]